MNKQLMKRTLTLGLQERQKARLTPIPSRAQVRTKQLEAQLNDVESSQKFKFAIQARSN